MDAYAMPIIHIAKERGFSEKSLSYTSKPTILSIFLFQPNEALLNRSNESITFGLIHLEVMWPNQTNGSERLNLQWRKSTNFTIRRSIEFLFYHLLIVLKYLRGQNCNWITSLLFTKNVNIKTMHINWML